MPRKQMQVSPKIREAARRMRISIPRFLQLQAIIEKAKDYDRRKVLNYVRREFHPSRSDRGKYVFVGLDGQPTLSNTRKGFFFYVRRDGVKEVLRDFGKPDRVPPPRRRRSWNLTDQRHKAAIEAYFKGRLFQRKHGTFLETLNEKKQNFGIDFKRFADEFAIILDKVSSSDQSFRNYMVEFAVAVQEQGERKYTRTSIIKVQFARGDKQDLSEESWQRFTFLKLYAFMAQALMHDHDMVTVGSAEYVARLKENRGKYYKDWLKTRGEKWEKNEAKWVMIKRIDWRIMKIQ